MLVRELEVRSTVFLFFPLKSYKINWAEKREGPVSLTELLWLNLNLGLLVTVSLCHDFVKFNPGVTVIKSTSYILHNLIIRHGSILLILPC